jgi:hypothetical protein
VHYRVDMLMIASFSMYPKCGMIGVSHSNRRLFKSTTKEKWISTQFPAYNSFDNVIGSAYTNINNAIGRSKLLFQTDH